MTVRKIMVLTILMVTAMTGFANEIDPHLAFMQPLLGKTWRGFLRSPDGKQEFPVIRKFERMEKGRVIRLYKTNRELGNQGEGFIWWNNNKKEVSLFYTENNGVLIEGTVSSDNNMITFQGTMSWPSPPEDPRVKQVFEFRNTFEIISESGMRDSWFQNAFGPWRPGHVIEFTALPGSSDANPSDVLSQYRFRSEHHNGGMICS